MRRFLYLLFSLIFISTLIFYYLLQKTKAGRINEVTSPATGNLLFNGTILNHYPLGNDSYFMSLLGSGGDRIGNFIIKSGVKGFEFLENNSIGVGDFVAANYNRSENPVGNLLRLDLIKRGVGSAVLSGRAVQVSEKELILTLLNQSFTFSIEGKVLIGDKFSSKSAGESVIFTPGNVKEESYFSSSIRVGDVVTVSFQKGRGKELIARSVQTL